jgi:hypothetical protein
MQKRKGEVIAEQYQANDRTVWKCVTRDEDEYEYGGVLRGMRMSMSMEVCYQG